MMIGSYSENEIEFVKTHLHICNREIAQELDRTEDSVRKFLYSNRITRNANHLNQIREKIGANQTGEQNPNWKNGISKNYYHYKKLQVERYPEKMIARQKVYRAKKSGKLIPGSCGMCGSTENIQAHHSDHLKPLAVLWYCREHHREIENEGSLFSGSIKQTVN